MSRREQEPGGDSSAAFQVFACLWAVATLFHQAKARAWTAGPLEAALTFAAVLVILRAGSLRSLLFLACLQVATIVAQLPDRVTNHWIFTLFIAVAILATAAHIALAGGRSSLGESELLDRFAPAARTALLLLYGFVVLHKLNTDFFNVETSCATMHYVNLATHLSFLPDGPWVRALNVYAVLATEAFIPIALVVPRLRLAGVLLALAFHTAVGVNDYFDFSAMLYALLVLFVADELGVGGAFWRWRPARQVAAIIGSARRVAPVGAVVLAAAATATFGLLDRNVTRQAFIVLGVVYGLALLALVAGAASKGGLRRPRLSKLLVPWLPIHYPIIALLVLNGVAPYLGLKTQASLAMFSNLRVEGGSTNHRFIPASAQAFGYLRDLVTIEDTSDPQLRRLAAHGPITYHTLVTRLRKLSAAGGDARVVYTRAGTVRTLETLNGAPEVTGRIPYLAAKLLAFRRVHAGPVYCTH